MSVLLLAVQSMAWAADRSVYLKHSSGMVAGRRSDGRAVIFSPSSAETVKLSLRPVGDGYYLIVHKQADGTETYMTLNGSWNTYFEDDSSTDKALYAIDGNETEMFRLRNKSNGRYLGTDANDSGSNIYSDKDGNDAKHYWYFSDEKDGKQPTLSESYLVVPSDRRQKNEGWGVSLCWWAGQCGNWSDQKIDEIVSWMVSPTGLNYSHFRYNIGGGDDPENRNCDLHHMGRGKGLRAEMEGFKDSTNDVYHWDRDAAQRKILLKIKEKRPDAVFEAFSNSCPYYMTYSGCCSGNADGGKDNLKPEYYEEFAHYLVDVCKHYKDEYGIEFKTLEPFNESVTNFWYANGPQEGCHFDYESQIKFIKVLSPILAESGLNTIISAADETNVGLAVEGVKRYISAGVDKLVGQWNTHTYSGNNVDRARFCQLAHQTGKPYWMSEVGAGGSGIGGNLSLTQKLFDDMRYIQPEAWIDWQYMEENNDQWCTIRGSFANQTYQKVKNFYIRQQCSRFIKRNYDIITSPCPQSLAAVNAERDTLVLVVLNEGSQATHFIDLSLFADQPVRSRMKVYRTSANENLASVISSVKVNGSMLTLTMPAQSISTLIIPIRSVSTEPTDLLVDGCEYLIIPRQEANRAVTASASKVTIEDINYGDAQRWTLTDEGNGTYSFCNALGLRLTAHRASNSSSLTAQTAKASEQNFYIDEVDYPHFKILASRGRTHGFDLTNASSSAGTTVGIWQYDEASNTTPTHRQWLLFPLSAPQQGDGIEDIEIMREGDNEAMRNGQSSMANVQWYDLSGRRISVPSGSSASSILPKGVYVVNGRKVVIK